MDVKSIAEQLLYTTVRIDTKFGDGRVGSGTGFLYSHARGENQIPVVVTNKHVPAGAVSGSITFAIGDGQAPKTGQGYRLEVSDFQTAWFGHPDPKVDIAVMPFAPILEHLASVGIAAFYRSITADLVMPADGFGALDAFEELLFIGYPNGIWDRKNLLPVMRTGSTATPMAVDFEGLPAFLIDASVFPGSSGSPVFIYNPGMWYSKTGTTTVGTRLKFVGVVASVFFRDELNEIMSLPIPTITDKTFVKSREMLDLGVVFKAHTVCEAVEALASSRGL